VKSTLSGAYSANMTEILKTMTVREAAPLWDDPRSALLQAWSEGFDVPLKEFCCGHILTYERERLAQVPYAEIWPEVSALRALLRHVGVGEEIESHYLTPLDKVKLTEEEMNGLPPRARAYIGYLEEEVHSLSAANERTKSTLRKINWGRKR
jgi:hypothetical protein